jgi:hypothetical protein
MKAQVIKLEGNYITLLGETNTLKEGQKVFIEDAAIGTNPQNRLFHKLITLWQTSGCSSYTGTLKEVKDQLKRDYGQGFECYYYADDSYKLVQVKTYNEIPKYIRHEEDRIRGRLKSWADYTKTQRMDLIQNLIDLMMQSGVNGKEFDSLCGEVYEK